VGSAFETARLANNGVMTNGMLVPQMPKATNIVTLYDIILFRDNEITDSRFTEEGQGASSTTRPYFFNGDLVYTKL
jgi:hypothetical protein